MLHLSSATPARWLRQVDEHLDEILIDHAHCERKAAAYAMNLMCSYTENLDLCRAMSAIVREELEHFQLVIDLLQRRAIRFRRLKPGPYGRRLNELVRNREPQRAVDRLLVAALIEARSCERFGLLKDHVPDAELAAFFASLLPTEARHHSTYVRLAKQLAGDEEVAARLRALADEEAQLIAEGDPQPRMHS